MISLERRTEINVGLAKTAEEEGIRVLYACESGSRAWGFPSNVTDTIPPGPKSDLDQLDRFFRRTISNA